MKKFKKIIALSLAAMVAVSAMSISVFAEKFDDNNTDVQVVDINNMPECDYFVDITPDGVDGIAPCVSYPRPTKVTSIASTFIDEFNSFSDTAFSDFYFVAGVNGQVKFSCTSAHISTPYSKLHVNVYEYGTDKLLTKSPLTISANATGKLETTNYVFSGFYTGQKFYLQFITDNSDDVVTGSYSIVEL